MRRPVGDRRHLSRETLHDGTIFAKTRDAECNLNVHRALRPTASAQTVDASLQGGVPAYTAKQPPPANGGGPTAMEWTAEAGAKRTPQPLTRQRSHIEPGSCPPATHTQAKTQPTIQRQNLNITVDVQGTTYELRQSNPGIRADPGKVRDDVRPKQHRFRNRPRAIRQTSRLTITIVALRSGNSRITPCGQRHPRRRTYGPRYQETTPSRINVQTDRMAR